MKQGNLARMRIRIRTQQALSIMTVTQMRKNPAHVVGAERWLSVEMRPFNVRSAHSGFTLSVRKSQKPSTKIKPANPRISTGIVMPAISCIQELFGR